MAKLLGQEFVSRVRNKSIGHTKRCRYCGGDYINNSPNQKFCSLDHQESYYQKYILPDLKKIKEKLKEKLKAKVSEVKVIDLNGKVVEPEGKKLSMPVTTTDWIDSLDVDSMTLPDLKRLLVKAGEARSKIHEILS